MLGCESEVAAWASARNWARRAPSAAITGAITVIATVRPVRVSRARNTSPVPPAPRGSRILYCPRVSNMNADDYTDSAPGPSSRELHVNPAEQPQFPAALHRPDDLAARRLVQCGRRLRAPARSDRVGDGGRVDDDRAV